MAMGKGETYFLSILYFQCTCPLPLTQVEGIVGTYIANRKTLGSRYGATVISFDKGGTWNLLTPPAGAVTSSGAVCVHVCETCLQTPTQVCCHTSSLCLPLSPPPPHTHTHTSLRVPFISTWTVTGSTAISPSSPRTQPLDSSWP